MDFKPHCWVMPAELMGWCGTQFCRLSARLAFGEHSAVVREKRNATVQSLSGTGSLRARDPHVRVYGEVHARDALQEEAVH